MLHTIAWEIFGHHQQEVYNIKQTAVVSVPHPVAPSPDDSLFRMCGAEVARMVNVRKGRLQHTDMTDPTIRQSIEQQIDLLKKICIPNGGEAKNAGFHTTWYPGIGPRLHVRPSAIPQTIFSWS